MYAPAFTSPSPLPSSLRIAWNLLEGAEVATFQAMDADVGPNSSRVGYSLAPVLQELPSNVMDGRELFSIESSTGSITLTRNLTSVQGQITGFVLFVHASDSGQPQRSAPLHMLTLMPISTTRFLPHPVTIEVDEELTLGTVITELRCDEIGPPTNTARVTLSGDGSEKFRIEDSFRVVVTRRIDYESLPEFESTFNITATCSNRFNLFNDTTTLSLTIRNIDDQPPVILSVSCTQLELSNVTTEIFSQLSTIVDGFECSTTSQTAPLIFMLDFSDRRVEVRTESQADMSLVADLFGLGNTSVSIRVCVEGSNVSCDPEVETVRLGEVTVSVTPSTSSAFPFGLHARDRSFRGVLDGARPMYPPASIPFFSKYYKSLFVSCLKIKMTTTKTNVNNNQQ